MAQQNPNSYIDPTSGFCSRAGIFHSLRPPVSLPSPTTPLSITSYILSSLHRHPAAAAVALVDAATRQRILRSELQSRVESLAYSLQQEFGLSKGDCAFILSINSINIPVVYLSLFALGVVASPSNPANSAPEILRQVQLSKPVIAFANSNTAHKLPASLRRKMILLYSPDFVGMMIRSESFYLYSIRIYQSDTAAILFSSGTTENFKGVELSHRNFISSIAGAHAARPARKTSAVTL